MKYLFTLWLVLLGCKLGANAPLSWWWVNSPLIVVALMGVAWVILNVIHEHKMATDPAYRAAHMLDQMAKQLGRSR